MSPWKPNDFQTVKALTLLQLHNLSARCHHSLTYKANDRLLKCKSRICLNVFQYILIAIYKYFLKVACCVIASFTPESIKVSSIVVDEQTLSFIAKLLQDIIQEKNKSSGPK